MIDCYQCGGETDGDEIGRPYCDACMRDLETHPVWLAIQRVENGETTAAPVLPLVGYMENYLLRTTDGWVFEVFPDGEPYDDWDYIESVVGPDGTRYEHADRDVPLARMTLAEIPAYAWLSWSPKYGAPWGCVERAGPLGRLLRGLFG